LTLAVNYSGHAFVWPVAVPAERKPHSAHLAASAAAEEATHHWVRMVWNGSTYSVTRRKGNTAVPEWPPEIPDPSAMLRLLSKVGSIEVIGSAEHPIVRDLLGHD
jgi:hypothetical protein